MKCLKNIFKVQSSVALKRIDKFMNSEELKSQVEAISPKTNGHTKTNGGAAAEVDKDDNDVEIVDANFQWESNQVSIL